MTSTFTYSMTPIPITTRYTNKKGEMFLIELAGEAIKVTDCSTNICVFHAQKGWTIRQAEKWLEL